MCVKLCGFYEENDDGGATYKIQTKTSGDVEDNGSIHFLNNGLVAEIIHKGIVNVAQFGAVENTDIRTILQKAIDYVATFNGTLTFPAHKLYYAYSISVPEGIMIDGNNSTLKKPNLSQPPYNYTVAQMKNARMFVNKLPNSTIDVSTKLTTLKNITLDGNALSMWQPSDGYAQEQASLIFVTAENKTTNQSARVYFDFENCRFLNNVSDGIHIRSNVVSNIRNFYSENCFRGGLTLTGGNSFVNGENLKFRRTIEGMNDGIDLEIDGTGRGETADDCKDIHLNLNNIDIDYDLDIASCGQNGKVSISNLKLNKGRMILTAGKHNGPYNFTNCHFKETNENGNFEIRSCNQDNNLTFDNCIFEGTEIENEGVITSNNKINLTLLYEEDNPIDDCYINFNNCKFRKLSGVSSGLGKILQVSFDNCVFEKSIYSYAIGLYSGQVAFAPKILRISNCVFMNKTKWLQCKSSYAPYTQIYIDNVLVTDPENEGVVFHQPYVYFNNLVMENGYKIAVSNGGNPKYRGHRTIIADSLIDQDTSQNIRFINEVDELQLSDRSNAYYRHDNAWISKYQ